MHPSTLDHLRAADSAAVSDAFDRLGLEGVVDGITTLGLAAVDDILASERQLVERLRDGAAASEALGARYERELET